MTLYFCFNYNLSPGTGILWWQVAEDALVALWDQYTSIICLSSLKILPCLLYTIKVEGIPIILIAPTGPGRCGKLTW